jgi:LPXTG-site transpeptidase (sortase) family protein
MRLDTHPKNSLAALAVSSATIVLGVSLMAFGAIPVASAPVIERVRAEVVAPPAPRHVPPIPAAAGDPSPECPQMNNPGGHLRWGPSSDPGPSPTGGRILLPSIGVDAPVVRVGVDSASKMVVPHNARDVAWLDRGGIPGYTNNVVLAGHIAYSRVAGSFGRIGDLKKGDVVELKMNGKTHKYRVVWNCLFGRESDRAEQIMGYTYEPSVTLISCGGGWDAGARTHTSRVAVRAEQIVKPPPLKLKRTSGAGSTPKPSPTARPLLDL